MREFLNSIEIRDTAHQVVIPVIGCLIKGEANTLATSTQCLIDTYTKQHGMEPVELSKNANQTPKITVVQILKSVLLISIPNLIKCHQDKDLLREVNTALNKFNEKEEQVACKRTAEKGRQVTSTLLGNSKCKSHGRGRSASS